MPFLAFPLRLEDGVLKRCEEAEAVVSMVRAMARTPRGSWSVLPSFGLRDFLEDARRRPGSLQGTVAQLNATLRELGISHYRVDAIIREAPPQFGVDSYVFTLVATEGGEGQPFNLST